MEKGERFRLFVQLLTSAAPARNGEEARQLLDTLLNQVEDEHSGVPYQPSNWRFDGRLYPPQDDAELKSPWPDVRAFRTRGHYVLFAESGAVRIIEARRALGSSDGKVVLDKPGSDGRCCPD